MECREVREQLSLYVDQALEPEAAGRVRDHLRHCPACAAEARELEVLLEEMRLMPRLKAPPGFLEGVRTRLDEEAPWKGWVKRLFTPLRIRFPLHLAGALAMAVLVAAGYRLWLDREPQPLPPLQEMTGAVDEPRLETARAPSGPLMSLRILKAGRAQTAVSGAPRDDEAARSDAQGTSGSRSGARTNRLRDQAHIRNTAPAEGASGDTASFAPPPPARMKTAVESDGGRQADSTGGLIAEIQSAILEAGGRVIRVEPAGPPPAPEVLVFSIHAGRYEQLVRGLSRFGRVEIEAPAVPAPGTDDTLEWEMRIQR